MMFPELQVSGRIQAFPEYGIVGGLVNRGRGLVHALFIVLLLTLGLSGTGQAAEGPVHILALGDSLTAGLGLPREAAFPARLEAALRKSGRDVRVINAGVSGDTSAGGLSRMDWALASVPGGKADAVIVELGANDGLRGLNPRLTERNLNTLLFRLKAKGIPVLLTGMQAPPNLGPEYGVEFAAVFSRLAKRHGVVFYPFFLEGVAARPELNQADAIHPNAAGVDIIVAAMVPYVEGLLDAK